MQGHAESHYWLAKYYFNGGILNQLGDIDKGILETESNPEYWRKIYLEKGFERAFNYAQEAVENGCIDAYLLLGFMAYYGIGVEKDGEQAIEYFKKAAKHNGQGIADLFLANYYTHKKNDQLAAEYSKNSNYEKVFQYYDIERLLENVDEDIATRLSILSISHHSKDGNYDSARNIVNKHRDEDSDEAFFALSYIDKVEKLEKTNRELHEKEKEMLSFFTHTMRNALATAPESLRQAIRLLGSEDYEKNQKHYEAINEITSLFSTLALTDCLIDTFKQSIYDTEEFKRAWQQDNTGNATPEWFIATALRQSLNRIMFMSSPRELKKLLNNDETLIKPTRKAFIEQVLPLDINQHDIDLFYNWLKSLTAIDVNIEKNSVHFGAHQIKFSLMFAISSELTLNALKYWSGAGKIKINWRTEQQYYIFSVENTRKANASSQLAGTHKGYDKLKIWLSEQEMAYTKLRRGIIEGCRYLKELSNDKYRFNDFIKDPEKQLDDDVLHGYLKVLENFLPLREPENKAALYKLFIRTLAHEWESADPAKLKNFVLSWIMKNTRNWGVHNSILFSRVDEKLVAYLFFINMRLMFEFDEEVQSYERILLNLISDTPLQETLFEDKAKYKLITQDIAKAYLNLKNKVREEKTINGFYFNELANNIQQSNSTLKNDTQLFTAILFQMFWLVTSNPYVNTGSRKDTLEIKFRNYNYLEKPYIKELARHIYNLSFPEA